jgi:hypothetical protein
MIILAINIEYNESEGGLDSLRGKLTLLARKKQVCVTSECDC